MKKHIITFCVISLLTGFIVNTQAQGISLGLRAGFDLQNINGKDYFGDELENSLAPRFNVGAVAEIPLAPDFFLQPGLLFSTKGTTDKEVIKIGGQKYQYDLYVSYLELPVSLLYRPILGNGNLLLGFGPYLGYGVGGNLKLTLNNNSISEKIKFTNKASKASDNSALIELRPLDFGGNIFFGYQLAMGVSFQINAQLGLANIYPDTDDSNDKSVVKNTGFGISLDYRF